MKRIKNKFLSLFLVLTIITSFVTALPITAGAADATEGIYRYAVENGEATLKRCNDGSISGDITIPSTLGGYPVTRISYSAFSHCKNITGITFPDSIIEIEGSFVNLINLEHISFGNNIKTIGEYSFQHCEKLKNIEIPDSVTFIGEDAFGQCYNLTNVKLSKNADISERAFIHCTSLKSIVIPDGITSIKTETFAYCENLKNITIPKSVTFIDGSAFYETAWENSKADGPIYIHDILYKYKGTIPANKIFNVQPGIRAIMDFGYQPNLYEIFIPDTVKYINEIAFLFCSSIKTVYYGGSEQDWDNIQIEYGNGSLTNATIHYNYKTPANPSYVPPSINKVTINYKGTAYGRFKVLNTDGTVAKNKSVNYKVNNGNTVSGKTDKYGYLPVEIKNITSSAEYNINISGNGIKTSEEILKVTVTPLHFKSNYEATFTKGVNAALGIGIGGSIGNLEAKAKLAEVGASGSNTKSLLLSHEYLNNKNIVTLTSKQSFDAAVEAKAGLFANADAKDIAGVEISAGDVHGRASYGSMVGMSFEDDDFKFDDQNDIDNISKFMLSAMLESMDSNIATRYIIDKLNAPVNSYEKGSSASLGGGARLGVISTNIGDVEGGVTLAGFDVNTVWTNSTSTKTDNSKTYRSGIAAEKGIDLINADVSYKSGKNSVNGGTSLWNTENADDYSIFASQDSNGNVKDLGVTAAKSTDNSIFWSKYITDNKETFTYTGDAAKNIANSYEPLSRFANGNKGYFSLTQYKKSTDTMIGSGETGTYSATSEYKKGIDIDLSASVQLLLEIGGKIGISGIESYEYENKNGIYENDTIYIQAENDIKSDVENEFLGVEDMVEMAKDEINNMLTSWWNTVEGWIDSTADAIVEAGNAVIEGATNAGKWVVSVLTPSESIKTMSLLAVDSELSLLSTSSVATTIGDPYIISIEDEGGNKITDFADNPLSLTIKYTQEQLAAAGVTDLNNISIMRWDDEKCVYIKMGGTLDEINSCVKLNITKPGQYILAVDNCPPAITQFAPSHNGSNPEISAIVSDMSGIADFKFSIDNTKLLDNTNFENYYNYTTAEFKYPTEGLTEGTHTATLYVTDTFGNDIEQSITFTVDNSVPEISNVTEIPDIISDTVTVSAQISGENISSVFLNTEITDVFGNTTKNTVEMAEADGKYSADMPSIENGYSVNVWVSAYNISGNKAESEKQQALVINKTDDNPAVVITKIDNGNISVKCIGFDDITNTKVYLSTYDNGGNLVQIKTADLANDITFNDVSDAPIIKAFIWKNMKPLCKSSIAIK